MSKLLQERWAKIAGIIKEGDEGNPELRKRAVDRLSSVSDQVNQDSQGLSRGSSGAKAQKLCLEIMQQKFNRLFVGMGVKRTHSMYGEDKGTGLWKKDPRFMEKFAKDQLAKSDAEMLDFVGGGGTDPKTGLPRSLKITQYDENDNKIEEDLECRFSAETAGVGQGNVDVQIRLVRATAKWLKQPVDIECKAGSGTIDVPIDFSLVPNNRDWRQGTPGRNNPNDSGAGPNGTRPGRRIGNPVGFNQSWGNRLADMRSALSDKLKEDVYFFITDNADSLNSFKICRLASASELASSYVDMSSLGAKELAKYVGNPTDAAQFLDRVLWGEDIEYIDPDDIAEMILFVPSTRGLPSGLSTRTNWTASFEISIDKLRDNTTQPMDEFNSSTYTRTYMDTKPEDNPNVAARGRANQNRREKTGEDYIDLRRQVNRDTIQGFAAQTTPAGRYGLARARAFTGNQKLTSADQIGGAFAQGCKYIAQEVNKMPGVSGVTADTIVQIAGTTDGFGNSCYGVVSIGSTGHSRFVLGTPPPLVRNPGSRLTARYQAIIDGFPEACRNYVRHLALQDRSWQRLNCDDIPPAVKTAIEKANRNEPVDFDKDLSKRDMSWLGNLAFMARFEGELDFEYDMCQLPTSGQFARNTSDFSALLPPLHPHSYWHKLHLAFLASGRRLGREEIAFRENYTLVGSLLGSVLSEGLDDLLQFESLPEETKEDELEGAVEEIGPGMGMVVESKRRRTKKYSLSSYFE